MSERRVELALAEPVIQAGEAIEPFARGGYPSSDDEVSRSTTAALKYQIACLLDDRYAVVNWPGRPPLVVNRPGGFASKYLSLKRIAKVAFRDRNDVLEVLDSTIHEYGLWRWANPIGFWTAFRHDMFDASKSAFVARTVPLERTIQKRDAYEGSLGEALETETDPLEEKKFLSQWRQTLHPNPVWAKWERAQASLNPQDRLVVAAVSRLLADQDYIDELAHSVRELPRLSRLVIELRALAACSQPEAYRLIKSFRSRYSLLPRERFRRG